jgi:hypothetical protein
MTALFAWLDSLPRHFAVLGLAWLLLVAVLAFVWSELHRRQRETCDRCGGTWRTTDHGTAWHFCSPRSRRVS